MDNHEVRVRQTAWLVEGCMGSFAGGDWREHGQLRTGGHHSPSWYQMCPRFWDCEGHTRTARTRLGCVRQSHYRHAKHNGTD
jgi:hypothetical protein